MRRIASIINLCNRPKSNEQQFIEHKYNYLLFDKDKKTSVSDIIEFFFGGTDSMCP